MTGLVVRTGVARLVLHWSFWQSHIVAHVIEALELQRLGREQVTLASGKTHLVGKYEATIGFGGAAHSVEVVEAGEPLIGMSLRWE